MAGRSFDDWELSQQTRRGLQKSGFKVPTLIQKLSIGPALSGSDIVGAAKTGSGKTLAFVIPLLEKLRASNWNRDYGVGALVLTPTRELAAQIFFVLKNVGRFHPFSAGAAFGGSTASALKSERQTVGKAQILIATPGRLLDHLESGSLSLDNLQLLVVDEADKLLEMGFREQLDLLLAYFPSERQTLLFSATQSRSTKDLSKLIQKSKPVFVQTEILNNNADHFVLPERLRQFYVVCPLDDKLNVLWSFTQKKGNQKCIVFLDTCNQVRFVYETFRRLRCRVTLLQLHGKMKQSNRIEAFNQFRRKQSVVLFATDVAARGLDFPDVNWVLQVDAPRDARTYVHRVGRTARNQGNGQAVTLVMPQEKASFTEKLAERGISVNMIRVRPDNMFNVSAKLTRLVSSQLNDLNGIAERAFVAYLREQCLFRSKADPSYKPWDIDLDAFAASYGLMVRPKLSKKLMRCLHQPTKAGEEEKEGSKPRKSDDKEEEKEAHEKSEKKENSQRRKAKDGDILTFFGLDDEAKLCEEEEEDFVVLPSKVVNKLEAGLKALRVARNKGTELHLKVAFNDSEEEEENDGAPDNEFNSTTVYHMNNFVELVKASDKADLKTFRGIGKDRKKMEKQKAKRLRLEVAATKEKRRRRLMGIPEEGWEDDEEEEEEAEAKVKVVDDMDEEEEEEDMDEEEEEEGMDEEEEEEEASDS